MLSDYYMQNVATIFSTEFTILQATVVKGRCELICEHFKMTRHNKNWNLDFVEKIHVCVLLLLYNTLLKYSFDSNIIVK